MHTDPHNPLQDDDDDDLKLQTYQDDFDTKSSKTDPIIDEETDDPTQDLGISPKEFKTELDKYDEDDGSEEGDDRREELEDYDQDEGEADA